jgi:hypothetical protein
MAGVAGGTTIFGADRGWGTIFRGSGRLGLGGATVTTGATGGATLTGGGEDLGRAGGVLCFASSFCLLARMAFITSPGLET